MNFRKVLTLSILVLASFLPDAGAALNPRHSHTITLLPDGNLLIVGGVIDAANTTTNNVQMYNMGTNTYDNWNSNLVTARSSHTATLMSDGRVLIAGGFNSAGTPLASLEICDPALKTCVTAAAVMSPARGGHTATLLSKGPNSGRVLLCGGATTVETTNHGNITADCDIFNPNDNTAAAIANATPMNSARIGHAAVLLRSGKVFVTGGRLWNTTAWYYIPMNEVYTPDTAMGFWTPKDALLQGRIDHTATVLNNGVIMIAGGYNGVNTYKCSPSTASASATGEECWTEGKEGDRYYWGYGIDNQDMGSHGFLDGAEYYDQNGGRTVIGESTFGTAPYRVNKHSAALRPDGSWNMYGGYGGIVRTVFKSALTLEAGTVIYLTKRVTANGAAETTANINSNSLFKFPVEAKLARGVSGRLVNADAFFSQPYKPTENPSISVESVKFYLNHSTAILDGLPVGTLIGTDYYPGDFDSILQLNAPAGTSTFEKSIIQSDGGGAPFPTVSAMNLTFAPVYPATSPSAYTGNITAQVIMNLSSMYTWIRGRLTLRTGTITDPGMEYSATIDTGGSADVAVQNPISCETTVCKFLVTVNFPVTGMITNLTPDATVYQSGAVGVVPSGADNCAISLVGELAYTADEVRPGTRQPSFNYGRSDIVIRDMIFTSALGFTPKTNTWKDLYDTDASPTLASPIFSNTALLTPAADTLILGGRNCETTPLTNCSRYTKIFAAKASGTVVIPVNTGWPNSEKLNSKRAYHTSTMLKTGQILTCGGSDGAKPLATCELMDPVTKAWTPTGSMNVPRAKHTASLLPNGTVLVAGGVTPSSAAVATAEVYYPDTQRWIPTTSMAEARNNHTATLLPDGNVLVAGGGTLSNYAATTELYISSTSYWVAAGPMNTSRSQHTATLLKTGNVLMTGGINAGGTVTNSEVFSYTARTFIGVPKVLNTGRYAHTATLLRDGRVLVIGGGDGFMSQSTTEIYDGNSWTLSGVLENNRANHRSVLLPNGKIIITGGETPGAALIATESYDSDFPSMSSQGDMPAGRSHHTTVLTKDNYVLNIGGWDGGKCLDTTDMAYFSYSPDVDGLETETSRQPAISSGDQAFNQGATVTLISDTSNFHSITEASGGSAGPANSSFSNPRVYIQQIDNPSGFMADISTRIYSLYGGTNANWEKTLSSITVIMPAIAGELPHGWYNMRVAANGQFSTGHTVQVTIPRPTGSPSIATGTVLGLSSITWSWDRGDVTAAEGYNVYSATDNVFITTVAFKNDSATVYYTQTGMIPNTAASIMVSAYNMGGNGPLTRSATYYTLAARPEPLRIKTASFESAVLEWARNQNSELTTYEVSMSPSKTPKFSSALDISTPVPFSVDYLSTSTAISSLSANQDYDFRVRAKNGAGVITAFTTEATTVTVSGVNNFTGEALSSSTINWSWDASLGATYYEIFDVTAGTMTPIPIGSTSETNFSQTGLSANRYYQAAVGAVKTTTNGPIRGPAAYSQGVNTLTVQPLPGTPNIFTNISTGSLTVNWITNGNSTWTIYRVSLTPGTVSSTMENTMTFSKLSPNVEYSISLTPVNGDDIPGTTLELGSKYTLAKVPASITAGQISMSGIWLNWDTEDNSAETIYEVRGSTNDNLSAPVVTHVPFSTLFTDNYTFVNGLLTSTSYYFDVAARNGEGGVTARKRAQPAFTLPGPSGAPSGSIGGTSDPSKAVTIAGTLPNNRDVKIYVPAGSFAAATSIAISSSIQNHCSYLPGGTPVEVAIFSGNNAQPQEPITLTLEYSPTEANGGITANAASVILARYNPDTDQCLPLETTVNIGERTITATLNHFSLFQLMVRTAASNLKNVLIYPNPFYANRGQGFVTIDRIPANSKVRIYTLSGEKVWEATAGSTGVIIWKGTNKSGYLVASGIYLAVIESGSGKKVFKIAVER